MTKCRLWPVFMVATTPEVAGSILSGLKVRAGTLDKVALRHALRGARLPHPNDFIMVNAEMLDAIDETMPLRPRGGA